MDNGQLIAIVGGAILFFAAYVFIARWTFKIDSIVFYLEKINEKLAKMEADRQANTTE